MNVFQCVVDEMGGYFAPFPMLNALHLRVYKQKGGCFLNKNAFQQPESCVALLPAKTCDGVCEHTRSHVYGHPKYTAYRFTRGGRVCLSMCSPKKCIHPGTQTCTHRHMRVRAHLSVHTNTKPHSCSYTHIHNTVEQVGPSIVDVVEKDMRDIPSILGMIRYKKMHVWLFVYAHTYILISIYLSICVST